MMQTKINAHMGFAIPGTHGNGQPYFADPYIAGADVTMGGVAALSNGQAVPFSATATTAVGILVNPNEHIKWELPSDDHSLVVKKGDTVAIAKKGSWYVDVPDDKTEHEKWVVGAKLVYSTTTYALAVGTTNPVAEVLMVDDGVKTVTPDPTSTTQSPKPDIVTYSGGKALIRFL